MGVYLYSNAPEKCGRRWYRCPSSDGGDVNEHTIRQAAMWGAGSIGQNSWIPRGGLAILVGGQCRSVYVYSLEGRLMGREHPASPIFLDPLKLSYQPLAPSPPAHFFRVDDIFVSTAPTSSQDPASTSPCRAPQAKFLSPCLCFKNIWTAINKDEVDNLLST